MLDACILFQGRLTNLLLHLAAAGAFEPVWSPAIHAEWIGSLGPWRAIPAERLAFRRAALDRAFPAACLAPPPELVAAIQGLCETPGQRKDAHVVACAAAAGAGLIATYNTRDFPGRVLARHGLRALRPEPFCLGLLEASPERVLAGLRAHRASLPRAAVPPNHYIAHLAERRLGLRRFAAALAPHESVL